MSGRLDTDPPPAFFSHVCLHPGSFSRDPTTIASRYTPGADVHRLGRAAGRLLLWEARGRAERAAGTHGVHVHGRLHDHLLGHHLPRALHPGPGTHIHTKIPTATSSKRRIHTSHSHSATNLSISKRQERSLFVHEKTSGFYRTSAYFLAKVRPTRLLIHRYTRVHIHIHVDVHTHTCRYVETHPSLHI